MMTPPQTYDLFISHAFEDKQSFADALAAELKKTGLSIWYSGFELKLGDSIATSISHAMKHSAFGIVIISPVYLKKQWAMNELNTLFAQESGRNRILPILHNISVAEVRRDFPILADRYTVSSAQGMEFVIQKIMQAINLARKNGGSIPGHPPVREAAQQSVPQQPASPRDRRPASIVNENNNNVNVGTGGYSGILIFIVIALLALAVYYFSSSSAGSDVPVIDKSHSRPSISD